MWTILLTMLEWSWKVLGIAGAWMLFKYVIRDGKDTIQDILETIKIGIQAGCMVLKRRLWEKIKRENQPVTTEATVE